MVSMPEASVDEDGSAVFPHHDVRLPWHALHVEPIAVAVPPQPLPHLQLGLGAFAVDVRHHEVTLFGGEVVGHNDCSLISFILASMVSNLWHPYFNSFCKDTQNSSHLLSSL